ncbi:MAG: hypothetical protein JST59_02910 [Actinobacteria bacterium]|nr:hypothetical protein [Actinomycetota bacterium]
MPHLDIVSLNTYQSLDIRSEKSMEQPPKGQDDICGGTCLRIPEDTFRKHVSDESFMIRFLMICIENERIGRISQQTAMRRDNDSKRIE